MEVSPDGSIAFTGKVTQESVKTDALKIVQLNHGAESISRLSRLWIGNTILEYAATFNCDEAQAVDELGITEDHGLDLKECYRLTRILKHIPPEVVALPELSITHLAAAAETRAPDDPKEIKSFNEGRNKILKEAAETGKGKAWVMDRMKNLKTEHGVMPSARVSVDELRKRALEALIMLDEWENEKKGYEAAGYRRGDIRERYDALRDALYERDALADPEELEPPSVRDL